MKKLIKSKLFLQVIVASMVATLATVGIVGAVSTIGENISTAGTLAAGATTITGALSASTYIGVASTSPWGSLSVEQGTETYSFLVGNNGSSTPSLVVLGVNGNGRVGIGSTTPGFPFSLTSAGTQAMIAYDGTNYLTLGVGSTGDLTVVASGGDISFSDENLVTTGTLAAGATTITGALSASTYIGVASTSPWGSLSVEQGTETYSFLVGNNGSSTPSLVVNGVNGNGRIGIASSTPSAGLSVGASTAATTTIDFAKPCFRMTTDNGTVLYYWPSSVGAMAGWATSTVSCF